jgi:hypothetical protein
MGDKFIPTRGVRISDQILAEYEDLERGLRWPSSTRLVSVKLNLAQRVKPQHGGGPAIGMA